MVPRTEVHGQRPLEGIKVVEFAVFISAPGAASILAELGADVVRVESLSGDPARREFPNFGTKPPVLKNGDNVFHAMANRNKRAIAIDVKTASGRDILNRLVKEADVFVTNLRSETKEKLGIDYAKLAKANPRIVYASVSGYGAKGPMANTGAFDPLGQAVSGMSFLGSKTPRILPGGVLDQATAIVLSHAILAALVARERHGVGQETHVSLYGAGLWLNYFNLASATLLSISSRDMDLGPQWQTPLRKAYVCKDGKWILGVHHPDEPYLRAFCEATGHSGLLDDERFRTTSARAENREALLSIFEATFLTRTREEWLAALLPRGLFFAPIHETTDVQHDPQALANRYVVALDDPEMGSLTVPGLPMSFSEAEVGPRSLAPRLGEDTDAILHDLGYSDDEIRALCAESVVK